MDREKRAVEEIGSLPATGLYREMLQDWHLNRGTTWKENDLNDIICLSCATGYADFVVCERQMGNLLVQGSKRLGLKKRAATRLSDVIPSVEAALL